MTRILYALLISFALSHTAMAQGRNCEREAAFAYAKCAALNPCTFGYKKEDQDEETEAARKAVCIQKRDHACGQAADRVLRSCS